LGGCPEFGKTIIMVGRAASRPEDGAEYRQPEIADLKEHGNIIEHRWTVDGIILSEFSILFSE